MKERMLLKIRFYPIANTAEIRFLPRNGKLHTGGYLLVFLFFVSRKIVWYWINTIDTYCNLIRRIYHCNLALYHIENGWRYSWLYWICTYYKRIDQHHTQGQLERKKKIYIDYLDFLEKTLFLMVNGGIVN